MTDDRVPSVEITCAECGYEPPADEPILAVCQVDYHAYLYHGTDIGQVVSDVEAALAEAEGLADG